ncbi:hypothetical protein CEP52_014661 [Fusarium oligoseptatum]|uniref:DEAD/DEAH box helicase n=1 Tax=Fusarium oligoseptatum TaxID=2604345 RepID=A0A428SKE9_9HYPO|nr:hypothetical protein CEP52_014661 [Fusarium oligoseptatum]
MGASAVTPLTLKAFASTLAHNKPKLKLRDYQEECISSVLKSLKQGHKRVGISLATGSGKTVIFTQLIDKIPPISKEATQTLILAHRRELVEQAAHHCQRAYPNKSIEIEMGNVHATGTADITVASVRSITSQDRLRKFNPSRFKLVLVDEAHHIVAPGYLKTLGHFGLEEKRHKSPNLVGVSATFSRFDGVRIGAAIDEIVYHKDYVDMISKKWLSDVLFTTVESHANLSKVKKGAFGDYQPGELSKAVNTDEINDITVRSWMAKAPGRKSTLVFCVDVAHVVELTERFRKHGFDARYVTGDTPKVERGETLDAFRNGEFPVLVNCGVFTEGTDIPNIDCIILGRPTRSTFVPSANTPGFKQERKKFVLSAPNGSYIRIEKILGRIRASEPVFRAVEVRALPPGMAKSPYAMPREILTAATFTDAVHGADSFAAKAFPHTFIHRYQPWRSLPPTKGQVDFINKLRGKAKPLTANDLTKGKAADMITKLKHGARGQFARIEAEQKKQARQRVAAESKRLREHVSVGPVAV